MKRIFFFLVICVCSYGAFAQSGFFVKNTHIEKWYREGKDLEVEAKKAMQLPEFQTLVKEYQAKEDALLPGFHFIDFNNNGVLDMLFNGKIGTQSYVFVFLRKENGYLSILEEKGTVIQANLPEEDNSLNLSVWHEACCGDYINSLTQWVCINTNNTSYFKIAAKSLVFKGTNLPAARIKTPVKCTLTRPGNLRLEPHVDNQKRIAGSSSWEGNSLGLYSPQATGTIYAEMRDNNNKFWYFVRMNNESGLYIHSNRFTHAKEIEDAQDCFTYGWISSDDVRFE